MIPVVCPQCQAKYRFDEALLKGKPKGHAKCKKCGERIEIALEDAVTTEAAPSTPDPLAPSQDTTARVRKLRSDEDLDDGEATMSQKVDVALDLPADKKYSLAVLQGKSSGQIFPITKSRTVIGRSGTDVLLDDAECSRRHAELEIRGSRATIRDLESTNGTFVNGKRIEKEDLDAQSEFRVGDHVMMLIVTDRE